LSTQKIVSPQSGASPARLDAPLLGVVLVMVTLWASAFPAISASLHHYSPGHLALGRYLVASVVLGVVALIQRWPLPEARDLPAFALMGLLGFTIYNVALNMGQKVTAAGVASFLVNVAPVFVVVFAAVVLHEKVKPAGWIGILISLVGIALLAQAKGGGFRLNPGALLIVIAALSAAGYAILQKRYLQKYGPLSLVSYCIWFGTLFMLVFAPGLIGELQRAPLGATLIIVYMGVFPTAIAYSLWGYVLSRIPVSVAISFIYLVPVLATVMSHFWLGEILAARSLLGGFLALTGVVVVNTLGRAKPMPEVPAE
jgi:drug/metabolite transporter (DMT)-like permease